MNNPLVPDFRFRSMRTAPDKETGAPLCDLTGGDGVYPSDVYVRPRDYYGGEPMEDRTFSSVLTYRGFPNRPVTVYRAVAADETAPIQSGDWVTISRAYAVQKAEETVGKDVPYKIQSLMVYARDIFTCGDSILEWGYDPQPYDRKAAEESRERIVVRAKTRARIEEAERTVPVPVETGLQVSESQSLWQEKPCTHWRMGEGVSIMGVPYPDRNLLVVEFIYARQSAAGKLEEAMRYLQGRHGTLAPGVSMPEGEPFWRKLEASGLDIDWKSAALLVERRRTPQDIAAAYLPVRDSEEKRPLTP